MLGIGLLKPETIYDYDTLYDLSEKDKAFQLKSIKEHQKEGEEYYNPQFDENYYLVLLYLHIITSSDVNPAFNISKTVGQFSSI